MNCIFCKVVNGEIPSTTVFESENLKVILDINPVNHGHMLILTKSHYNNIFDVPENLLSEVYPLAKRLSLGLKKVIENNHKHRVAGVNVLQNNGAAAGQEVSHFHLHIIPRFAGESGILKITRTKYNSVEDMVALGEKIRQQLSS